MSVYKHRLGLKNASTSVMQGFNNCIDTFESRAMPHDQRITITLILSFAPLSSAVCTSRCVHENKYAMNAYQTKDEGT